MSTRPEEARPPSIEPLVQRAGNPADLLVRGAHLLDPATGLDGPGDLLVRNGVVEEIAESESL